MFVFVIAFIGASIYYAIKIISIWSEPDSSTIEIDDGKTVTRITTRGDKVVHYSDDEEDRRGRLLAVGQPQQTLRFEYADAHGEITERSVVNWKEYPQHIVGHCLTRGASRTFRKDSVLAWHEGRQFLADDGA